MAIQIGLSKVLCQTSVHTEILKWMNRLLYCKHTEQVVGAVPNPNACLCSCEVVARESG